MHSDLLDNEGLLVDENLSDGAFEELVSQASDDVSSSEEEPPNYMLSQNDQEDV
jgi:hypothetical protein